MSGRHRRAAGAGLVRRVLAVTVPVVGAIAVAAAVVVTVTPGEQPVAAQGEQGEQTGPRPAAPLAAGPAVPGDVAAPGAVTGAGTVTGG